MSAALRRPLPLLLALLLLSPHSAAAQRGLEPTIPEPMDWTPRDRELWDALVFNGFESWESAILSVTIVITPDRLASINICQQGPDVSYVGEIMEPYGRESWREWIRYWSGHSWAGEFMVGDCSGEPDDGWIHVRAGETIFNAQANTWQDFSSGVPRWQKAEIVIGSDYGRELPKAQAQEDIRRTLAHELGHVMGFWHVPHWTGFIMSYGVREVVPPKEREMANLAYRVGPGVQYPGLVRPDDLPPPDNVEQAERAALAALYDATDGPNWFGNRSWLTAAPLLSWYGVGTNEAGRVEDLVLGHNNLAGWLPADIGDLTNLYNLNLSHNNLTGAIPPELGNLRNLRYLYLDNNRLIGPLPSSLTNLRLYGLHMENNAGLCAPADEAFQAWLATLEDFTGETCGETVSPPDDMELAERAALTALYDATDGPSWFGNRGWTTAAPLASWYGVETNEAGRVTALSLFANNLSGQLPAELGNLTNLELLSLDRNNLTGSIPPELGSLRNLFELSLYDNNLSGPIPPELSDLANMVDLYLYNNNLSGPILPDLADLPRLRNLYLNGNALSGQVPPELGRSPQLGGLVLNANNLAGPLPSSLTNLRLDRLHIENNAGLCAPADEAFQAWLATIRNFTGQTCEEVELAERAALTALYDATDGPSWFGNRGWTTAAPLASWYGVETNEAGRVTGVRLSANNLSGRLPAELGELRNLEDLLLDRNNLSGPIPPELGNLKKLWNLYLQDNNLSGSIPPELSGLANVSNLHLNDNNLTGRIPPELADAPNLHNLYLHGNALSGQVPAELGRSANLGGLFLNDNNLSGPLPSSLTNLRLHSLHIENNAGLCAPADEEFQVWLATLREFRGETCGQMVPALPHVGALLLMGLLLMVGIIVRSRRAPIL